MRKKSTPACMLPFVVLLGIGALILHDPERINHDCALYLQCGTLLLEGKLPYVDFVDINPPLVMYLNTVPALLARLLSVGPIPVFSYCVLALAACSTWALQAQLRGAGTVSRSVTATAAGVWAGFSLLLWGLGEFGQREHLLVLLYVPFLILRWREWSHGTVRCSAAILLGVGAGVGLCLKPLLALGPLVAELYFVLSQRTLRPLATAAMAALIGTCLLYAMHFALLPQAVRDGFFHRWLPLVWKGYAAYDSPFASTANRSILLLLGVSLAGLIMRLWASEPLGALAGALAACTLGCAAAYFLQRKDWFYHLIPALAATVLLMPLMAAYWVERLATQWRFAHAMRVLLFPLVLGASGLTFIGWAKGAHFLHSDSGVWGYPFVPSIETYSTPGEPILFVSTSVVPAYPLLVQSNRRPGSRYLWFFPLAMMASHWGLRAGSLPHELAPDEARFVADVADDIATRRPPLIFVTTSVTCQGCPTGFNMMDYFVTVGLMDKILQNHDRLADVSGYARFVRRDRLVRERAS